MLIDCPHCGKKISDTAKTCAHCLKAVKETPPPKIYCPECGELLEANATVCPKCGLENVPAALEKQEKEKLEIAILVDKADEVTSYAHTVETHCKWISNILGIIGFAFLCLGIFYVNNMYGKENETLEEAFNRLSSLKDTASKVKNLLAFGFIASFLGTFFSSSMLSVQELPVIAHPFILIKMNALNFKELYFFKNFNKFFQDEQEVIRNGKLFIKSDILLTSTRIKNDKKERTAWLIRQFLPKIILLLSLVLLYVVLSDSIDNQVNAILLSKKYKFDFTSFTFIAACALLLVSSISSFILNRNETARSSDWLKKLKKQ